MARTDSTSPVLPYWASAYDPEGKLFPVANSGTVNGQFVGVATVPMLEAALPLYRLGGVRATLLLPLAGTLAWAAAASALARRFGRDARLTFFVVAFASPAAVYALTFWEHSLGVAAMMWALVVLVDVSRGRRSIGFMAVAGLLFGIAGTMRTEALAFGAVLTAFYGLRRAWAVRRPFVAGAGGMAAGLGLLVPLVLNDRLEWAVLGTGLRAQRATGAAAAGGTSPWLRLRAAGVATLAPLSNASIASLALGAVIVGSVALGVWWSHQDARLIVGRKLRTAGVLVGGALVASRYGFVPGLFITTPLAIAGALRAAKRGAERELVTAICAAMGAVLATQYIVDPLPLAEWSGRYLLMGGSVLLVLGLGESPARRLLIGASIGITAIGLVWSVDRSHRVDSFFRDLNSRNDDVVISRDVGLLREAGAAGAGRQWLNARTPADLELAINVAKRAEAETVLVIAPRLMQLPKSFDCFTEIRREPEKFLSSEHYVFLSLVRDTSCVGG